MKMLALLFGFVVACGVVAMAADADPGAKKGKLRHVVAFKFKDTASKESSSISGPSSRRIWRRGMSMQEIQE
jgi:hypothetical protein